MIVKLERAAHCRSGDKGNTSNIAVIAYAPELYPLLKQQLSAERFRSFYRGVVNGKVTRYEIDGLQVLNFVAEGALGGGVPHRDLYVTPEHAFFFEDVLINASALVNDSTVYYAPLSMFGDSYTVYHIETEQHEVIIAEGAWAETFIDYGLRSAFDNSADCSYPNTP